MRRRLFLRLTLSTAWAAALALVGLRLLTFPSASGGLPVSGWLCQSGGWSLMAMAQVVFGMGVADRLLPHANPWLCGIVELFAAAVMTVGGAVVLVGYLAGY